MRAPRLREFHFFFVFFFPSLRLLSIERQSKKEKEGGHSPRRNSRTGARILHFIKRSGGGGGSFGPSVYIHTIRQFACTFSLQLFISSCCFAPSRASRAPDRECCALVRLPVSELLVIYTCSVCFAYHNRNTKMFNKTWWLARGPWCSKLRVSNSTRRTSSKTRYDIVKFYELAGQ